MEARGDQLWLYLMLKLTLKVVLNFFLRGIFLLRKKEIDWFYKEGASKLFPDYWESYLEPLTSEEQKDPLPAYYRILSGPASEKRVKAAKSWSTWEAATSKLMTSPDLIDEFSDDDFATALQELNVIILQTGVL